jgi:hypothetical protein
MATNMLNKLGWLMLVCLISVEVCYGREKILTRNQAEFLAQVAAEPTGITKLEGFTLDPDHDMKQFPEFYFFSAYVSVPGAQGTYGHYAVNKFTGDVWDPFGCYRLTNPKLETLEKNLRKKLGLNLEEYLKHQKTDPCLV